MIAKANPCFLAVVIISLVCVGGAESRVEATPAQNGKFVLACSGCPLNQSGPSLYTLRTDGRDLRRLTRVCDACRPSDPVWSADGSRLAYSMGFEEIWIARADGTKRRRVFGTRSQTQAAEPTWSPDGTRLAFIGRGGIWILNVDSGRVRVLLRATRILGNVASLSWSPDGREIAFGSTHERLYLVGSDGRGLRSLGGPATRGRSPRWSPDSRRLTFLRLTDRWSLGVIRRDGSGLSTLAEHPEIDWNANPVWSPDGRSIAFTISHEYGEDDTITGQIMITRLRDGRVSRVEIPSIPPEGPWAPFTGLDWQPVRR